MQDLEHQRHVLQQLTSFLEDYLPLANAHVADFLIEDYWHRFVPDKIRDELLQLNSKDLALLPSGALYPDALESVRYVRPKEREKCLEDHIVKPIKSVYLDNNGRFGVQAMGGEPRECSKTIRPPWDRTRCPVWNQGSLKDFVRAVQLHTLPTLNVLSDLSELLLVWRARSTKEKVTIRQFMSEKKCHEVDVMADVCAALAESQNIKNVVDIGSGRGYLSSYLALMHGLEVLAVDSSDVNTRSAQIRSQRLKKHWNGLVRRVTGQEGDSWNQVQSLVQYPESSSQPQLVSKKIPTKSTKLVTLAENKNIISAEALEASTCGTVTEDSCRAEVKPSPTLGRGDNEEVKSRPGQSKDKTVSSPSCISITEFVTPDTDLRELVKTHFSTSMTRQDKGTTRVDDKRELEMHSVNSKQCNKNALDPYCNESHVSSRDEPGVLITGLHTCGNLAPSMLRLFIHGEESARVICNVGCCYHHLDEEFTRNPFLKHDAPDPDCSGFPLSKELLARRLQLGRNARMLASQTPARMATTGEISHKSLFYRAVLQVLLRDLTGEVRDDWQVGKIFAKSHDFADYVRRALQKLKLEDSGKVTKELIANYMERYAEEERRLSAFVQLRATLAPSIEALILLDRLIYLKEQVGVSEAHLVRLFDPVTSPRCYGIIAIRSQ